MRFLFILLLLFSTAASAQTPSIPPPDSWVTDGEGQALVLYQGKDIQPLYQGNAPSCVGCAAAKALEIMHGVPFSPEWIYAASRDGRFLPFAGSQCGWAVQAAMDSGVLPSASYAALGYDLSVYDPATVNSWSRGPPDILYEISDLYRTAGYYHIRSWKELRGAVANGYPVIVGSSVGFGPQSGHIRNSRGELRARWWSSWLHAMVFIGVDDAGGHKAALLLNSWGPDWISGPQRIGDEPPGSFWATKRTVQRMINDGDAYAIRPIRGM